MTYCLLIWVVGRTVTVNQGVAAWLSHGHVAPHSNQLVPVTLASWQGSLWGYLPPGQPRNTVCCRDPPAAIPAAGILACSTVIPVVISQYQGTQLLSIHLALWKGPGRRTCQQIFLSPYCTFFCFWGANGKHNPERVPCMQMCVCLCVMWDTGWSQFCEGSP